jgi:molybdopterin/thiamine biosynthesis adenylyltransferase
MKKTTGRCSGWENITLRKIKTSRLFCIGAGGTINPFLTMAMHNGFQNFTIVDGDTLDETNLNRFLGADRSDPGKSKVSVMKKNIRRFNPDAEVNTYEKFFPDDDIWKKLPGHDLIVCGVDNEYARYMTQLYARLFHITLIDMGSGIYTDNDETTIHVREIGGQVKLSRPSGACLVCMGLNPASVKEPRHMELEVSAGYIAGSELTPPSVITLNSVIAATALSVARDYISGNFISENLFTYDELNHSMKSFTVKKNTRCPLCGDECDR